MPRFKDVDWNLPYGGGGSGTIATWEQAGVAVMMDVRDELRKLNRLLGCTNFLRVPWELGEIRKATQRANRRKRKAPRLTAKKK